MAALSIAGTIQAQNTIITEAGITTTEEDKKTTCQRPRDGFYDRTLHKEKMPLPYDHIHEKDVFWEKKIWREVDLRHKMNHTFTYAKRPLINILKDAVEAGEVTFYGTWDDEFSTPLSQKEQRSLWYSTDTIPIYDPENFTETITVVENEFNPEDVLRYRIKEVWYFDEETSSMGVRIIGIAPIVSKRDDQGNVLHEAPMFWAYYPELRKVFAQEETFNPMNDAARLSWDDLFEARMFASVIVKENNNYDRRIKDYKDSGVDQLVESERIQEGMRNFEHDLWSQ